MRIVPCIALLCALSGGCSREPATDQPRQSPTATAAATLAAATAAAPASSRYTLVDDCKVVASKRDEDWSDSRCVGPDGAAVTLAYGDARDDIALGEGEAKVALGIPALGGGGFNTLGPKLEWRGREAGGRFAAHAVIVRNRLDSDPAAPDKPGDRLVVIDLKQRCVVAMVKPGAGQNAAAQGIADGPPARCLRR